MKKIALLLAIFAIGLSSLFAQTKEISGTVTSADDGSSIPGVSVVVKGTTLGTVTDLDGEFNLKVPEDAQTLIFSFVGMQTQEAEIGNSNVVDVSLLPDVIGVDEVIVVAYGQQKRSEVTGSVATVRSEKLEKIQASNVLKGLDGEISGVQIIHDNGQPGEAPVIRIRGIGSISGSSNPLYVVDGVPFNGNITSIDPMDIANISVLKDASANALYGHRGANGVIIITTKKGKRDGFEITVDVNRGVTTRGVQEYDIMKDASEYYEFSYLASRNSLFNGGETLEDASASAAKNLITDVDGLGYQLGYNSYNVPDDQVIDPATGKVNPSAKLIYNEDWDDFLYDAATKTKAYINLSGGTDNSAYFMSIGYDDNEGYAVNSGFDRFSTRFSIDQSVTDFLEIGANINYSRTEQDAPIENFGSGTYANLFNWSRIVAPIYPVRAYDASGNLITNADGSEIYDFGDKSNGVPWIRTLGGTQNPYATTLLNIENHVYENVSARFYGKIHFLKDFTFTYNGSVDMRDGTTTRFATPVGGDAKNAGGRGRATDRKEFTTTHQQLLDWNKSLGLHNFSVLLGHEASEYEYRYFFAHKSNFLLADQYILDGASKIEAVDNYERNYNVEGFFSRLTYDYDNKYVVNLSFRRDGSSVFHPDNRWGNFWGAGVAWNISKEDFMKGLSFVNNLKLKASFGQQGNDIVYYPESNPAVRNYYAYRDQYEVVSNNDELGLALAYLGNKDLTWETSDNMNIGFESVLFNSRLALNVDFFKREITDLLYNRPLPVSTGAQSIPENIGDMENRGIEIETTGTLVKNNDLTWNLTITGTHYKNEITKLPQESIDDGRFELEVGRSRYDYYRREFAGVDPENGDALFYKDVVDDDGNPTGERETTNEYSEADEYFLDKTSIPDLYGGFSTSLDYKGFDLEIGFSYQLGGYGYDATYFNLFDASQSGQNYAREAATDTWTPENKNAKYPRIDQGHDDFYYGSSMFLTDASYLSLRKINLGYTFSNPRILGQDIKSVRIYANADNIWLWSKRQGYDPRLSVTGLSQNEYSIMRTVTVGVNVKF